MANAFQTNVLPSGTAVVLLGPRLAAMKASLPNLRDGHNLEASDTRPFEASLQLKWVPIRLHEA